MRQKSSHSKLARNVLAHIVQSYPEKSGDRTQTQSSLDGALESLKPFQPDPNDIRSINGFLVHQQASDVACKAAWALYKDIVNNQTQEQD